MRPPGEGGDHVDASLVGGVKPERDRVGVASPLDAADPRADRVAGCYSEDPEADMLRFGATARGHME